MSEDRFKFRCFDEADGYHRDVACMSYNINPACDADVIMQCTGLRDKNGVLVYEGDIAKVENWRYGTFTIIWENGAYRINSMPTERIGGNLTRDCFEIIGNIYENPEMLDAKEGET